MAGFLPRFSFKATWGQQGTRGWASAPFDSKVRHGCGGQLLRHPQRHAGPRPAPQGATISPELDGLSFLEAPPPPPPPFLVVLKGHQQGSRPFLAPPQKKNGHAQKAIRSVPLDPAMDINREPNSGVHYFGSMKIHHGCVLLLANPPLVGFTGKSKEGEWHAVLGSQSEFVLGGKLPQT